MTWQGVPVDPPQAVVLVEWLLPVLDVAGKIPVRPGIWERNANANTLAPTATITTPTAMIRMVFVTPPVADLEVLPI